MLQIMKDTQQPLSSATANPPLLLKGHTVCTSTRLLKGIYVNLHARPERSVQRTRGREKPKKPPLPFCRFHTSPRARPVARWLLSSAGPSVRRFACTASTAPRLRPGSQTAPSQANRSHPDWTSPAVRFLVRAGLAAASS